MKWESVHTPFIEETDWEDLSRRPISDDEDGFKCPSCQGIFPHSCLMIVPKGQANQRQYASCGSRTTGEKNTKLEEKLAEPAKPVEEGKLASIAARVLMKVFYATRLARFDLLRAVANLARYITKWDREMDLRLMKLMQYVKCTLSYRQTGWIADPVASLNLHLYADANFGGSLGKSTSGIQLNIEGPHSSFPIEAMSSAQQAVSHSTPEAEIVAGDIALRKVGHCAMVFWGKIKGASKVSEDSSFWAKEVENHKTCRESLMREGSLPLRLIEGPTDVSDEESRNACGATAAQKRARKEDGIARKEERVKEQTGDLIMELEPKMIMHDDNTAMIQVCRSAKTDR